MFDDKGMILPLKITNTGVVAASVCRTLSYTINEAPARMVRSFVKGERHRHPIA